MMKWLTLFGVHPSAFPDDPVLRHERHLYGAVDALAQGDIDEAKAQLHLAIADNTESAPAYNLLGVAEAMAGHVSLALCYFRIALVLDPTYEPARANLVRPAHSIERYELGVEP